MKIIATYVLSLVVVYIVIWCVLSVFLFQPLEQEREQNMIYNAEKIVSDIRGIRENYDIILYRLSMNHIVYKALSDKCINYEKVWEALTSLKYLLTEDMALSPNIKRLQIYQNGSDIGQDGEYVFSKEFEEEKWEGTGWESERIDSSLLLCKYQKISFLYNDVKAYFKIAIDAQSAFGNALELGRDMQGNVYLTNKKNSIMASSNAKHIGGSINEVLPKHFSYYESGVVADSGTNLIMKNELDEEWDIWLVVRANQFGDKVNRSQIVAGIILLGYGICSGLILGVLLHQVFGRLSKLGEKMKQIHVDNSYISISDTDDEVAALEVQYNGMLNTLNQVIDEMAEVKSQKQKFEFKSLESQINPHFLYNTLGVMRWEALECGNQKLVTMIDALTTFYRLTLNKGKGLLRVEQELKLVEAYMSIQQMRWDHVVEISLHMDESVKEIMMPKMILQPLVENIWLHGNIVAEGNRKIAICALDKTDYVAFTIWDNGDGISKEVLAEFQRGDEKTGDTFGIGIQFIRNILRYYYGDDFIYEVTSEKQKGTTIQIVLPKKSLE